MSCLVSNVLFLYDHYDENFIKKLFIINNVQTITLGILDIEICFDSLQILREKFALKAGSSKHGKAALACVGSN